MKIFNDIDAFKSRIENFIEFIFHLKNFNAHVARAGNQQTSAFAKRQTHNRRFVLD